MRYLSVLYRLRERALDSLSISYVCRNYVTMSNIKVLVTSNDIPRSAIEMLKKEFTVIQCKYSGFETETMEENKKEISRLIEGVDAIFWACLSPLTKQLIEKAGPQLKVVATCSAGYNHIDINTLKAKGIKFGNTPKVLDSSVAEIAIGLMTAASRRFTENLSQVKKGKWELGLQKYLGHDIRGSTVGIVGLGGIGQAIVKRLSGFEVDKFLYSGHKEKPEAKALNATFVTQDELLNQSDFVVLACPLNDETKHMINENTLKKMKKNAILVNIGRGPLIDQNALCNALMNGVIWAAGLDVTTPEPLPADHPLLTLPNCFILPHIGSATVRTRTDMAELAANNVINGLKGLPLLAPVL